MTHEPLKLFSQMESDMEKVTNVVKEIRAAAEEQHKGVDQLNQAINELNQVVQENASQAEELAAVSAELDTQSKLITSLLVSIGDFTGVSVDFGGTQKEISTPEKATYKDITKLARKSQFRHSISHTKTNIIKDHSTKSKPTKELKPENVIPLDDDFSDF